MTRRFETGVTVALVSSGLIGLVCCAIYLSRSLAYDLDAAMHAASKSQTRYPDQVTGPPPSAVLRATGDTAEAAMDFPD